MIAAALYARKSTDQHVVDEAKSVERQIAHARAFAIRNGWTVADAHIFVDDGISGAEFANRPGFMRLMSTLTPRPPFSVLVMSEASRLGREQFETGFALKRLSQAGVRCFSYLDAKEIALDTATEKFMMSAATFAAELEREKSRQRVADTLQRKARAGHVVGGKVFGYDTIVVTGADGKRSHVERRILEPEAAVVRRIFALSAGGTGFTRIAKLLNAERALCPRPAPGSPAGWAPTSIRAIVLRPLYRGEVVYNMTRKRDPWGQRKTTDRPEGDWIRTAAPTLRIVSDDVWYAAQARLTRIRAQLGTTGPRGSRRQRDIDSPYLLSGFARCAVCGGGLCVTNRTTYACMAHHKRGAAVCTNSLALSMARVDDAVLDRFTNDILQPDAVMTLIDGVLKTLAPRTRAATVTRMRSDVQGLDREVERLAEAIAAGGQLVPLLDAMKARQARRASLVTALASHDAFDGQRLDRRHIEAQLRARMDDWRSRLTGRGVQGGRQVLREVLVGPLRFTPEGRRYRFEGDARYDRLLSGLVGPLDVLQPLWCARQGSNLRPPA